MSKMTKKEYKKLEVRTMELKDVLETYVSMITYSYSGIVFVDLYERLCNFINGKRDKYDSFLFDYDHRDEAYLITWSFIVGLYGDYGTSPRSGWIRNKRAEELKSDLKWALEERFFCGNHEKIKDDQKLIKIITELQHSESSDDEMEILEREGIL